MSDEPNRNDNWILGLVGVGAGLITVTGQYTILYSLVGVILIAVVTNVGDIHKHDSKFIRAYSCVYAMCVVLALSAPINATLVSFEQAGHSVIFVAKGSEEYRVETTHFVMVVLWAVVALSSYLRQRRLNQSEGAT